jgi:SAM-dependent methyltransferase
VLRTVSDLLEYESALDRVYCGTHLEPLRETRFKDQGAHDPTATHYFVLEQLFEYFAFDKRSHLLDVGCGAGRALAYFLHQGYPGRATGIELDPSLASIAKAWTDPHANLTVKQGNVLDLDLGQYTDFYLFNPFDASVLQQFIREVEAQVARPCTVVHMSDNGDSWWYVGRDGWTEVASGEIQGFRNARGVQVKVYETPQHYTVWRYAGGEQGRG